jgi:hypothetical protein
MIFESEYRRQAMEKWQSSRVETEREIVDDLRKSHETFKKAFDRFRNRIVSLLPYGRSHNRYE